MRTEIEGFEGRYYITNSGVVEFQYSPGKFRERKLVSDKDGYLTVNMFTNMGKLMCKKVHRMVACAYIDNSEKKEQVNHKDGNKQNNSVNNLEWCTPKENVSHSLKTGLKAMGSPYKGSALGLYGVVKNGNGYSASVKRRNKRIPLGTFSSPEMASEAVRIALNEELNGLDITSYKPPKKVITQFDKSGNIVNVFSSISEAERHTGIPNQGIGKVILGKSRYSGGFFWSRSVERY